MTLPKPLVEPASRPPAKELAKSLSIMLCPDAKRTVIRPFLFEDAAAPFADKNHHRVQNVVDRVLTLDDAGLKAQMRTLEAALSGRHRDVERLLLRRYEDLDGPVLDRAKISREQALVLGAYFSEEFSFESAALFNPSVVRHPDQSGVAPGDLRLVISLRGIGEGHISSMTFRTGVWRADGSLEVDAASPYALAPRGERSEGDSGELIVRLFCDGTKEISETVIYPFIPSQGRGIEDVRLVEFTEEDGAVDFRGTYTAFNGSDVRQGMLRTADFKTFEMRGVQGALYSGKGMALFPRKVDGRYMMLGRQDNENIWLIASDDLYHWEGGDKIIAPKWPWEFVQIGNCGSPIEIDEGWLVMTHGVGVARNYCIGACLLDKRDPRKVLARMEHPLIEPGEGSRDGYVPNVVYSCGSLLRDRTLLVPYGVADNFATFASVEVDDLLGAMS
jgi:predicted GH43/DUF377 family glycosyl hydrolase